MDLARGQPTISQSHYPSSETGMDGLFQEPGAGKWGFSGGCLHVLRRLDKRETIPTKLNELQVLLSHVRIRRIL